MRSLAFVSGNLNKAAEIIAMGRERGISIRHVKMSKVEVQAETNTEIAIKSAREAYAKLKVPLIVEDSGISIDALGGFPGTYAAYAYSTIGLKGILTLLKGKARGASFNTTFCYTDGKTTKTFVGVNRGTISAKIKGGRKFAYDMVFVPKGYGKTFSQLDLDVKNRISHRSIAFNKFADYFLKSQKA
ncbi:MAG TPA: non-canonical purine NTP pyrophosphatase [Candidatus Acidoferrales bacterium]|nr:non-canonical purine NTP pyrophosphatase [Candidatus Acidoferrales bacterium]